jgi:hypothetical protein
MTTLSPTVSAICHGARSDQAPHSLIEATLTLEAMLMRHHRVLSGAAVLAVLFVAGCGSDAKEDAAAPPVGAPSSVAAPSEVVTSAPAPSGAPAASATPAGGPAPTAGSNKPPGKPGRVGSITNPVRPVVSAEGVGPYQVAVTNGELKSAGLLGTVETSKGCPDFVVAKGLASYHTPVLVFFKGKLQYVSVTSSSLPTDQGAAVGMSLADVKKKHPAGKQLSDWNGGIGWFAQTESDALLFRFKNSKVETIEAGLAETLQFRFTDGEGC